MSPDSDILHTSEFMTLATICGDGSPWSVPVKFAFYEGNVYWRSSEATVHSQNIARDARVFINIYETAPRHGMPESQAVYLQTAATKLAASQMAAILKVVEHKFSSKDKDSPVYGAPIGIINTHKSSDNRFYRKYDSRSEEVA